MLRRIQIKIKQVINCLAEYADTLKKWANEFKNNGWPLSNLKEKFKKMTEEQDDNLTREEKEFLPAALEIVETPAVPKAYYLLWTIIAIFMIALTWSIFGYIEEVAVAEGKIIPAGYTKAVQAEDKGVVKKIFVDDGDKVQKGDILIELDTTITLADLDQYRKEQAYYELEMQRLEAEQQGKNFLYTNNNPFVLAEDIEAQTKLYQSRLEEYQTKLKSMEQSIRQTENSIIKEEALKDKLQMQYAITSEQEGKMQHLAEVGAVSLFQYQEYKMKKLAYKQDLTAETMEITRLQNLLTQYKEEKQKIENERNSDIMTKLVEDRRQMAVIEEAIKKAEEKHRLSILKAPIDGKVQQLSVHTTGAVVTEAEQLMLIVPENTPMQVEAWLENKDIGFVYEGQKAEIKVETFNFQKYGTLPAEVVTVSADATETRDGRLLYKTILKPLESNFNLANGRIVPICAGMSVTAEIKTREKRIIEYFLDPFIKYKSEGLRER